MTDEVWEDVAFGPPAGTTSDDGEWEDVAYGPPAERSVLELVGDTAQDAVVGSVRGLGGLAGLIGDAAVGMQPQGTSHFYSKDPETGEVYKENVFDMPVSSRIQGFMDKNLPEYNNDYVGTVFEFATPGGAFGKSGQAVSKGASKLDDAFTLVKNFLSRYKGTAAADTAAGLAAQGAEDYTGDDTIAPIIASVLAGGGTELAKGGMRQAWDAVKPASSKKLRASAAYVLRESTGLDEATIRQAIDNMPDDELAKYMSTAEVTGDVGMGQIEKTLGGTNGSQGLADQLRLRAEVRDDILDSMSGVEGVDLEDLAVNLRERAKGTNESLLRDENKLWTQLPRKEAINVAGAQKAVKEEIKRVRGYGTRGLNPQLRKVVDQFTEGSDPILRPGVSADALKDHSPLRSSGALQKMRSEVLDISRDTNISDKDRVVANMLAKSIDDSMSKQLNSSDAAIWHGARDATKGRKEIFNPRTSGGKLLDDRIADENLINKAIRGSRQSVRELRAALGDEPELLEGVKRAVLDSIPRDVDDKLTAVKFKRFLGSKKGSLRELFGDEHFSNMQRIAEDLASEQRVGKEAFAASRGNSVTSQKMSVAEALSRVTVDSVGEGSGLISRNLSKWRNSLGRDSDQKIKEILMEAALDPNEAAKLVAEATDERLMSAMERFSRGLKNFSKTGARELALSQEHALSGHPASPSDIQDRSLSHQQYGAQFGQYSDQSSTSTESKQRLEQRSQLESQQRNQQSSNNQEASSSSRSPNSLDTLLGHIRDIDRQKNRGDQEVLNSLLQDKPKRGASPMGDSKKYEGIIRSAARESKVSPTLLRALVAAESDFDPDAIGYETPETKRQGARAVGLGQLMPATAKEQAALMGIEDPDLTDPETNLRLAAGYLKRMLNMFGGDVQLALTAYHSGPGTVAKLLSITDGSSLADIRDGLGPVGRDYADAILRKV